MSVGTCPRGGPCARTVPLSVSHAEGANIIPQSSQRGREREGGEEGKPQRPLPPVSTDMQTGSRREGGREEGGKTHPFHRPLVHQWASQEQ